MPISIEVGEICLKGYAYYDQRREQQERNTLYKRLYDLMDRLKSITLKPWMNPVEVKETARKDARFEGLLLELENIKVMILPDGQRVTTEISRKQREILNALDLCA